MIEKDIRSKILNRYNNKEEKIFASSIIDLINKFDVSNHIVYTKFINLHEKSIAISILNIFNIEYHFAFKNNEIERNVIFLIPKYIENVENIILENIKCLKIIPNIKNKLLHKDYMGVIYSLGIEQNMIGDIFANNECAYFFIFSENLKYFENNLINIGKASVKLEVKELNDSEIINLKNKYKEIKINVKSLRVDLILSEIFNFSRNETKLKIENGDLFINSLNVFFVAEEIKENDIISFKKCGKLRIEKLLGTTKSGKYCIDIKIYN